MKIDLAITSIANLTCHALNNSQLYIASSQWTISNNKITPTISEYWRLTTTGYPIRTQTANVSIYKVVGYKY